MKAAKSGFNILNNIQNPADLKKLNVEQLPALCRELRDDLLKELSVNPGHMASSMGTIELTVALHYVYNTPDDRIVWDVGHQAYGHKILTGRIIVLLLEVTVTQKKLCFLNRRKLTMKSQRIGKYISPICSNRILRKYRDARLLIG